MDISSEEFNTIFQHANASQTRVIELETKLALSNQENDSLKKENAQLRAEKEQLRKEKEALQQQVTLLSASNMGMMMMQMMEKKEGVFLMFKKLNQHFQTLLKLHHQEEIYPVIQVIRQCASPMDEEYEQALLNTIPALQEGPVNNYYPQPGSTTNVNCNQTGSEFKLQLPHE